MSALGPLSTPAVPAGAAAVTPAGTRTAQAAFFRAALESAAAPRAWPAASSTDPASGPAANSAPNSAHDPAPMRHGRPGALLDIRV